MTRFMTRIARVVGGLQDKGIEVSLFVDPDAREIRAAKKTGAQAIEIHTGRYCLARTRRQQDIEFKKIKNAATLGLDLGFIVNAGHGLNYENTRRVARINGINELNIGHSILSRAVFSGLKEAVQEMKRLAR